MFARDNQTLIVTDCESISQMQLDAIKLHHPRVKISMHACNSSSAGYVCIFMQNDQLPIVGTSSCFQLTFVFVSVVALLSATLMRVNAPEQI